MKPMNRITLQDRWFWFCFPWGAATKGRGWKDATGRKSGRGTSPGW